jgi:hypothetical protein
VRPVGAYRWRKIHLNSVHRVADRPSNRAPWTYPRGSARQLFVRFFRGTPLCFRGTPPAGKEGGRKRGGGGRKKRGGISRGSKRGRGHTPPPGLARVFCGFCVVKIGGVKIGPADFRRCSEERSRKEGVCLQIPRHGGHRFRRQQRPAGARFLERFSWGSRPLSSSGKKEVRSPPGNDPSLERIDLGKSPLPLRKVDDAAAIRIPSQCSARRCPPVSPNRAALPFHPS